MSKIKLMTAAAITKQQDLIAKTGVKLLELVRENANQCLLHFKTHGDITLAERLLASLPPGMVVAGLAKWFKDFAPVKFDAKGKAEVTGKPEETKVDEALAKDWTDDKAVQDRGNRPIEPFTPAMIKGRIKGMVQQLKKAEEQGGRGFGGATEAERKQTRDACFNLINKTILIMDNVDLTKAPASDVIEAVTGKKDRASRRGAKRDADEAGEGRKVA